MLTKGNLYKLSRGNQNSTVGFLVVGDTATLLGSQAKPSETGDMIDLNGGVLAVGFHTFAILPEYISVDGDATSIDIIGVSIEDLGVLTISA